MRKRTAVIHIGTAKTGTTTIQRMLAENRGALLARGICFPHSPGEVNHFRLAIAAAKGGRGNKMARVTGEAGDAAYVADRFARDLAAEMAALPETVHSCVFSNEHCYRKVDSVAAAQRLKAMLDPHFDRYRIVVYLRRQDEMMVSVYSTRLRSGDAHADVLPAVEGNETYLRRFDWFALCERWAAAFGREAIAPRVFDRASFVGGDLLKDFCHVAGLGEAEGLAFPKVVNSALSAPAQEFLRRLNIVMHGAEDSEEREEEGVGSDDDKAPRFIRQFVDHHYSGRGRRPSRAQAEAILRHFAPANEALRTRYFPGRETLFPDDLSRWPETPDPVPTEGEVLDIALRLIADQAGAAPGRAAEQAFLKAGQLLKAGEVAKARPHLNRALARDPGHVDAMRALLDSAGDEAGREEARARLGRALRAFPDRADLRRLAQEHEVDLPASEATVARPGPKAERPAQGAPEAGADTTPEEKEAQREQRRAERREERRRQRGAAGGSPAAA